jgi:hypothetical protein
MSGGAEKFLQLGKSRFIWSSENFAIILDAAIREVLDLERYNEQLATEKEDSAKVVAVRQRAEAFFRTIQ